MKTDALTKEQIIDDLLMNDVLYKREYGEGIITRDYYMQYRNKKIQKTDITKYFGSFENLKKESFPDLKEVTDKLTLKKKTHILEEKVKELEKENNEIVKNQVLEEKIISEYETRLEKGVVLKINKPIEFTDVKGSDNREALLFLSDWHCGEVVLPEEVNGVNDFNSQVMIKRLDRIFYYFIHYCNLFKVKKALLVFGGDLLSGSIHPELARTAEMSEVDCLFLLQEYISKKLIEIEKHFSSIRCEFVVGNHSRISVGGSTKPEYKTAGKLNWEYILSKQLKMEFDLIQRTNKVKKIDVIVNDSLFKVVEVGGRRILITHGHVLCGGGTGGFAGIPVYSLAMSSAKIYGALHQIGVNGDLSFQDIMIGHLHSTGAFTMFNGGKFFLNGSIIGTNEFSLYKIRSIAKIEQTMLIIEEGKVSNEIVLRGEEN